MVRFITSSLLLAFGVLFFASAPSTAELSSRPSSAPSINKPTCAYMKSQKPDCALKWRIQCGIGGPVICSSLLVCDDAPLTDQDFYCPAGDTCAYIKSQLPGCTTYVTSCGSGEPIICSPDGKWVCNNVGEHLSCEVNGDTSDGVSNLLGNFGVATTGALLLGLL